jgi:hypothetical protein
MLASGARLERLLVNSKQCKRCEKTFYRVPGNDSVSAFNARRYCSIACTNAAKKITITRGCLFCCKQFSCRPRDIQRFCSAGCGQKFSARMLGDTVMTQEEVAIRLGMDKKQVQYHEAKALRKLYDLAMQSPVLKEYFDDHCT